MKTELVARMEARWGEVQARAICIGRKRILDDVSYMDVKMLSELLERYRARVRKAVAVLRAARGTGVSDFYAHFEHDVCAGALEDALLLWRMAHEDYHAAYKQYMVQCAAGTGATRRAA